MTDEVPDPIPAVAVSPNDQTSDRTQSDADNVVAVASQTSASGERATAREQAVADQAVTAERLDRLIAASERQTATNEDLALATVEYQERARLARKRFRLTIVGLIAATAVILAALAVILSKINDDLISAGRSRAQIADCITPKGKCYQDGQKRTNGVLQSVNKIIVLAAACAPNYVALPLAPRTVAIEQCIEKGLTK